MLVGQVLVVNWTQAARSGVLARKRADVLRQHRPLPASATEAVTLDLITCYEAEDFKPSTRRLGFAYGRTTESRVPFSFHATDTGVRVLFNPAMERDGWRPARFSKPQADGTVWKRPTQLFTLAAGQAGKFTINYYQGSRTFSGASKAPAYQQIQGEFYHQTDRAAASHGTHSLNFVLDETQVLR